MISRPHKCKGGPVLVAVGRGRNDGEKPMAAKSTFSASGSVGWLAACGDPPLIPGEDRVAYDELLARVSAAVEPADIFEEIWVRDVVDHEWEVLRLRRLKVNLLV